MSWCGRAVWEGAADKTEVQIRYTGKDMYSVRRPETKANGRYPALSNLLIGADDGGNDQAAAVSQCGVCVCVMSEYAAFGRCSGRWRFRNSSGRRGGKGE